MYNLVHMKPRFKPTPGKLIALLLIPVLLYLAYIAGSRSLADIYARPVMTRLSHWEQGKVQLGEADWASAQEKLARALKLDPTNPELLLWMGLAIEGPYRSWFSDPEEGEVARQQAAAYYRQSIQLQPTWPYAWADLATVKYRAGEVDEELFEAMQTAIQLGPYETGVLSRLRQIIIVAWTDFPDAYRETQLAVARNSLVHGRSGYALDTLRLLNRTGTLKKVSDDDPRIAIDAVLRFSAGGNRNSLKEMLLILDKNDLWGSLTQPDKTILRTRVDTALENANPAYTKEVETLIEGKGL